MSTVRRSMLFIPGNSPGMILNSFVFGADSVILDLEDAVAPNEKDAARMLVKNALSGFDFEGADIIIRINSLQTKYWKKDLEMAVPFGKISLMPTKVQGAEDILELDSYVSNLEQKYNLPMGKIELLPLLETALGVENAFSIAKSCPRITALYLGAEDLSADLSAVRKKEGKEIFYSRSRIVVAARAAGLPALDTPFTDVDDMDGLLKDATFARDLGFSGKAVISPRHIDCVNKVFSPSLSEIEYARNVIDAFEDAKKKGKGAVSLNGKMIDMPIVERAKKVLDLAQKLKGV